MQRRGGNDVSAVRREVMGWCMRPTVGYANFLSQLLGFWKAISHQKSDAKTHRTPKALRANLFDRYSWLSWFPSVEKDSTVSPPHAD